MNAAHVALFIITTGLDASSDNSPNADATVPTAGAAVTAAAIGVVAFADCGRALILATRVSAAFLMIF